MEILDVKELPERFDESVDLFRGMENNRPFYAQCMDNAHGPDGIPCFNVWVIESDIVGGYALLRNDINSRHDLYPWFACLYVKDEYQGNGVASKLLQHGIERAKSLGFANLYLESNLDGFYEKRG